jgi:SPP1 family predicted phage head-tail adaptor
MIAGALNKRITIEKETTAKNAVGTPVETYAVLKKTFATIKYITGGTDFNEGAQAYSSHDFSIRFDSAVDYRCRIVFEGEYYKILAIELIGQKDGMRLKCIKYEL